MNSRAYRAGRAVGWTLGSVLLLLLVACGDEGGPAAGGAGPASTPAPAEPRPAGEEFGFRPRVADRPAPTPGAARVYAGQGTMKILVHAGAVERSGELQLTLELKPDGTVTGSLRCPRIDLMSGNLRGPLRHHEVFGTHADGKATLGTVDERGARSTGWLRATYDASLCTVRGEKTQTEIGITVTESMEARLRPR